MQKQARQDSIKAILNMNAVETQEQLVLLLADEGVEVTQATVSRDIKEMQLVKVPLSEGHYRYSLPLDQPGAASGKFDRVVKDALLKIDVQDYFVNLTLTPGSGPAVASLLQAQNDSRIFAPVPADASLLLICRSASEARSIAHDLNSMVG